MLKLLLYSPSSYFSLLFFLFDIQIFQSYLYLLPLAADLLDPPNHDQPSALLRSIVVPHFFLKLLFLHSLDTAPSGFIVDLL